MKLACLWKARRRGSAGITYRENRAGQTAGAQGWFGERLHSRICRREALASSIPAPDEIGEMLRKRASQVLGRPFGPSRSQLIHISAKHVFQFDVRQEKQLRLIIRLSGIVR